MKSIKVHELVNKLTLLSLFLLYSDLISACLFTISCNSYIPTVSYMGTFRVHDLALVMAIVVQGFSLFITFISYHCSLDFQLSNDDQYFMIILEIAQILLAITCTIIDESSGLDFNPVDDVHRFVTFALMCCSFTWVYFALKFFNQNRLSEDEVIQYNICWTIYTVEVILVLYTIAQWVLAYTTYNNFFFNHAAESIFEWASITVAIRFPYHLCRVMGTEIKFVLNKKDN